LKRWERLGQAKVALKIDSEDDMLMLQAQATVLGFGPAPRSKLDEVTGHLKLL
jgi:PTH2 family peptidyl-tRNA hydrolase